MQEAEKMTHRLGLPATTAPTCATAMTLSVGRTATQTSVPATAAALRATGVAEAIANEAVTVEIGPMIPSATVERGINGLAISQPGANPQRAAQNGEPEPDPDWDPSAAMDEEAAQEVEIQRRRRAREAALKRAGAVVPSIQALQGADNASTPGSTRQTTPAPVKTDANTPNSNGPSTPALSPSHVQSVMSPTALNFVHDQDLAKSRADTKTDEMDGPSAADYDPTVDMREDERRDEMRYGNVGLHGEARRPSVAAAPEVAPEAPAAPAKPADDDDDFDMFAEDFDDKFSAPAPSKTAATQDGLPVQSLAGGGGNVDGDDKDGYYKIRPGEILEGRIKLRQRSVVVCFRV